MDEGLKALVEAWDEGHREMGIALEGTPDTDLWTRPHPRVLSIGETVGHVAYWQATWVFGEGGSPGSPLLHEAFRYYTESLPIPFVPSKDSVFASAKHLNEELLRVHRLAVEAVGEKAGDDAGAGPWGNWRNLVQYQVFHVAYHTGQVYVVRHLLGHATEDN